MSKRLLYETYFECLAHTMLWLQMALYDLAKLHLQGTTRSNISVPPSVLIRQVSPLLRILYITIRKISSIKQWAAFVNMSKTKS